jgi:hypothetical protein
MKLRTITLIAGIAQLITLLCGFVTYFWPGAIHWRVTQPFYLLAHAAVVMFFFTLVARQNNE